MVSVLSRAVRAITGKTVGEAVGTAVGYAVTGGSPVGASIGGSIGGSATEYADRVSSQKPDTTQTVNPPQMVAQANQPRPATVEIDYRGQAMPNPLMNQAVFRAPTQPMLQQQNIMPVKNPLVGGAIGIGAAAGAIIIDMFSGQPQKLVITKKLKRETQELMALFMNDMDAVADQLSALKAKQFTPDLVLLILMKKFTNQGPYVTKAAVRKTRQTVRKLSTLRKLEAEICKPTTRRRAAPRASMTKTSIVKA